MIPPTPLPLCTKEFPISWPGIGQTRRNARLSPHDRAKVLEVFFFSLLQGRKHSGKQPTRKQHRVMHLFA